MVLTRQLECHPWAHVFNELLVHSYLGASENFRRQALEEVVSEGMPLKVALGLLFLRPLWGVASATWYNSYDGLPQF